MYGSGRCVSESKRIVHSQFKDIKINIIMQNNIFLGGSDPLLGVQPNYFKSGGMEEELARIQAMQQQLDQKKQEIANARQNISGAQQASRTPVWDEIDKIVSDMSDSDLEYLNASEEFQRSNQAVMAILQREQLRMMRPLVEGTKDGKEALEAHLALVRKLKKESVNESNKAMVLFKEYTEHYADMPYAEFLKMKRKTGK